MNRTIKHWYLFVLLVLSGLAYAHSAHAAEEILSYQSNIEIDQDGSMTVRETIRVRTERKKINHGIYRDFPTDYKDHYGHSYKVLFDVVNVVRDGHQEDFHFGFRSNGRRVYMGNKNDYLQPGEHEYTLTYRTNRQLGFFEDYDELYWNVTGNNWEFPILNASASIHLPRFIAQSEIKTEAYTGVKGSREKAYTEQISSDGTVVFQTTRILHPGEGFTIVTGWPKGVINEPGTIEKVIWLLGDNRSLIVLASGMIVLLLYYGIAWHYYGRDPKKGVIIPQYLPPKDFSPASIHYIWNMGYNYDAFSTALINMAVKGFIEIEAQDSGYILRKKRGNAGAKLAPGENAILNHLFKQGSDTIELNEENSYKIRGAIAVHKKSILRDYAKLYFTKNRGLFGVGVLLTIAIVVSAIAQFQQIPQMIFGGILTALFSFSIPINLLFLKGAWDEYRNRCSSTLVLLFAVMMGIFHLVFLFIYAIFTSVGFTLMALLIVATTAFFAEWLKAPTRAGRSLLDKLEGFKLYLEVAEKDELNLKHPLKKTPELFEMYLPYALALGVENNWAKRFAKIFEQLNRKGQGFQPTWYRGDNWNHFNPIVVAQSISNDFSSAITSAASPPNSSSGFGGGSSGDGGGGGGGGGW